MSLDKINIPCKNEDIFCVCWLQNLNAFSLVHKLKAFKRFCLMCIMIQEKNICQHYLAFNCISLKLNKWPMIIYHNKALDTAIVSTTNKSTFGMENIT